MFFGTSAYAAGLAAEHWHVTGGAEFALLPLGAAAAAVIAVPFGLIALRVRRHTFVVITIAIFFIFQLMAFDLNSITNGTIGLNAPFLLWDPITFDQRFYYIALALAVATIALAWLIKGSRFGLQLRAIRDDEDRAASLGVRAMPVKLTAFVISGAVTGLAGVLWFFFIDQVQPQTGFDPLFDLTIALMAFLGGLGTISGPVLGALIIAPAQQYLTITFSNSYLSQILLGALFLAVVIFVPRGLVPTVADKGRDWLDRRKSVRASRDLDVEDLASEREAVVTALLQAEGVSKAVRRRPGPGPLHSRGGRRIDHRTHRAQRVGQDDALQCDHRVRPAGRRRGLVRGCEDHGLVPAAGLRGGHRQDIPADEDLPQADGAGEHDRRRPAQRRRVPVGPGQQGSGGLRRVTPRRPAQRRER